MFLPLRSLALLAGMLLLPLAAVAEDVPSILWSRHDHAKAAWVSLERATLPNGQIDWNLFGDLQSAVLKRRLEGRQGDGCVLIGALRKEQMDSRVPHDLKELAQSARGIYRGTVVARSLGFAEGDPATLLAVQVDKTIKSSSEISAKDILYVVYPVADLVVNGVRICKSDERLTEVPEVGDGVLVFPLTSPLNEEQNLIYPFGQEVIVQKKSGALAVPSRWAKDSALGKASSLYQIETMIKALDKPTTGEPRKEGL